MEVQLADARRQLEEANRQHEQMVRAIKTSTKEGASQPDANEESLEEKVVRLQHELNQAKDERHEAVEELQSMVEPLQERASELELQLRVLQSEHELEIKELMLQVQDSEAHKGQMVERVKLVEASKHQMASEAEAKYQEAVSKFESELELLQS